MRRTRAGPAGNPDKIGRLGTTPREECMRFLTLAGAAFAAALAASSAAAQTELKIMAPAAPGGGWDQTARAMQQALVAEKLVRSVQVTNVAGAGGSVGLAQFVNGA